MGKKLVILLSNPSILIPPMGRFGSILMLIGLGLPTNIACDSPGKLQIEGNKDHPVAFKEANMSKPAFKKAKSLLDKLNSWEKEELDLAEHPSRHDDMVPAGETNSWIHYHKSELKKLAYEARWNSRARMYELHTLHED